MPSAKTAHRIAFVSDAIYPYNKGGKETRLHEISTRLAKRGYDVHIYCMKWWTTPEMVRVEEGVTLHAISPLYPLYSGERRSIKQGVLFGLACLKLFKEDFDVIEVDHMPYFPLYAIRLVSWLKAKKMFATWHEVWGFSYWVEYMGLSGYIAGLIEYVAMKLPDTFISVSDHTTGQLQKFVPKEKIVTIPNGVDIEEIRKAKPYKLKSDVIYAGRLLKHKNVNVLIDAIKLLTKEKPNIRCLIVGNGPEEIALKKKANALKLEKNITFIDFCKTKSELYGLMKRSKVFVLPSSREGFGFVAVEAFACGIPTVTTNHKSNAVVDIIHSTKYGIIISISVTNLAQAILGQIKNKLPKRNINSKLISLYSWEANIIRSVNLYMKEQY